MKFTTTTVFVSLLAGALAAPLSEAVSSEKRDVMAARAAAAVPDVYTLKTRADDAAVNAVDAADDEECMDDDKGAVAKRDPKKKAANGAAAKGAAAKGADAKGAAAKGAAAKGAAAKGAAAKGAAAKGAAAKGKKGGKKGAAAADKGAANNGAAKANKGAAADANKGAADAKKGADANAGVAADPNGPINTGTGDVPSALPPA
ncbi:hypothetical protein LMH87_003181 [Akanthomyces muscarius]|uniref:Uncharacterized protein n=1 Tax=Akanthomyces muscarius TaxID=2231603 RepID=A0A9W8Q0Y9_AKAMU|nr:hypothetical protein LMH87_003181 [Akanthomyces muscarius]KAJ4144291.1 hypothetical protein LMH87_003181 [Akanthomyces muscarius]